MKTKAVVKGKKGIRSGKGFSKDELGEVGLNFKQALKLGIPIDKRRRSVFGENIKTLRKLLKQLKSKKS